MKLNIRMKTLLRVALLVAVVAGLFWYVARKRVEWEQITRPLTHMDDATAVLAPLSPPAGPVAKEQANSLAITRLERDRARAAEEEKLRELAGDPSMPDTSRQDAGARLTALIGQEAQEAEFERLLKEKGFTEALVTLGDHNGRILIRGQGELSTQELAQVSDLAKQVAGLKPWELTVILRP